MKANSLLLLPFCLIACFVLENCTQTGEATYPYSTDEEIIAQGNRLFDNSCVACHNFRTTGIGPNLSGLTREVSEQWLKTFIKNPMEVINSGDERAKKLFEQYKSYMPPFPMLTEEDIDAILAYIHTRKKRPETPTRTDWGPLVTNPIPQPIQPSGLTLTLKEVAQLPPTAESGQQARINKIAPLPDGSKLFAHDLRGKLYELKAGKAKLFLNLAALKPAFIHIPGHGTGMGSFTFHPEYADNGIFYTSHTEDSENSPDADFGFDEKLPVKLRWVVTEWKQTNPAGDTFEGSQREIVRIDMRNRAHGMQEIAFNPLAKAGDEDYGLLYIGIGDGGAVGSRNPELVQDKGKVWGCILRIDPMGNNSKNGHYGIPDSNPFVGEEGALGEIYAMGFRNPHRFTWDAENDGHMLASEIGQHFIEELNLVVPGADYGWPEREGTFRMDKKGDLAKIYPLPEDDTEMGYTYPVAQFDHDEGLAICGGYVYQGEAVPELKGKYIFGEIVTGRIFVVDASELELGKQAEIMEVSLQLEDGQPAKWEELTNNVNTGHSRVDFRMGIDAHGELYMSTKANGKIFKVIGGKSTAL